MGLAPAEVAAGVAELLAAHRLTAQAEHDGARQLFRLGEVLIAVGPLPAERMSHALFHPRSLLVLEGEGRLAEMLKAAIRVKFLRVGG